MAISVSENIHASKADVWKLITDIEHAEENISGIVKVNILNRPEDGVIGLKWEETRTIFGKEAVETMWISNAEIGSWYETTALNSGCEYTSRIELESVEDYTKLTMSFRAKPLSLIARVFYPLSLLFNGMIKKAFEQDLKDLKSILQK